jgi:hypothetical protein
MKKYIVSLFLIIYSTIGLRAAESTSPKDYLKKENYEIVEINLGSYPNGGFHQAIINENSLVLFSSERGAITYFNPITKEGTSCNSFYGEFRDLNDKDQICGKTRDASFIWSTAENKVDFFGGIDLIKILNDGSCLTSTGAKMTPEGNITISLHLGRYWRLTNKNGQYPSETLILDILEKINLPGKLMNPIAYNSKSQLLFRNGNDNIFYLSDSEDIHCIKNPLGKDFAIDLYTLNDCGVIGGGILSLIKPDQDFKWQNKACLWHNKEFYFLNDVFGGDYRYVHAINNRGDMVVLGSGGDYKPYIFLRKRNQKSDNDNSKKNKAMKKNPKNLRKIKTN